MVGGIATAAAFGMPVFWTGIFVGTILTATSVSISAQVLMELGVLRSKEGSTILGAAVIDDVMGLVVLSVVVAFAQASGGVSVVAMGAIVARMVVFFGGAVLLGRYFERILAWGERLEVSQGLLATVAVLAFVYAWAAEYVGGVAAITGSYLAGVLLTRTTFKKRIDEGIHPLTYSILVPVFLITIGLRANGRELGPHVVFTVVLIAVAVVGKILGSGGLARRVRLFEPRVAPRRARHDLTRRGRVDRGRLRAHPRRHRRGRVFGIRPRGARHDDDHAAAAPPRVSQGASPSAHRRRGGLHRDSR